MKTNNVLKTVSLGLLLVAGSVVLTHCTRQGDNLKVLDRGLAATDSTVFAQFQDKTIITTADAIPDVNDIISGTGIATIIQNRCGAVSCHGGTVAPALKTYSDILALVTPGNPEGSKLWNLITTNDFNKAMPPVYAGELSTTEKVKIYNWIKNGANERPKLADLRPHVMHLITSGCASVQCHNDEVLVGDWARRGLIPVTAGDTTTFVLTDAKGVQSNVALMNKAKTAQIWGAYKDSVRKFYANTTDNASFKPVKTVTRRSPFNNYDDVLFDIMYPKGARSKANYLDNNDCFMRRVDSTLIYTNQVTKVDGNYTGRGNMTWDDSHWFPEEIALFKEWYFLDNNIPAAWKFGEGNQGIFRYNKTGKKITK